MSNAARAISTVPVPALPAPRGCQYLDVKTAARLSGDSERTIRRKCETIWMLFAKKEDGEWLVREDADPSLARVRFADDLPVDLKSLSDQQRRNVQAKCALLKSWRTYTDSDAMRGHTVEAATAYFLEELASGLLIDAKLPTDMKLPTERTLWRWQEQFNAEGLAGLIDGRGTRQAKPVDGSDPFFESVKFHLFDKRQRSKKLCWELACKEAAMQGFMTRSYSQTKRFINKIPNRVMIRKRKGFKFANGNSEPYIERDYSGLKSNEVWCSDEHTFDVWVKHRGVDVRPFLVAFEDMASRKIVGWKISARSADTDTVLAALHMGVSTHGLPEKIYVDNGKVYDNRALSGQTKQMRLGKVKVDAERMNGALAELKINIKQTPGEADQPKGALADLEIDITHANAFNAKAKPIERFFGTVCDRFSKLQPTYTGKNPLCRPDDLKAKLKRGLAPSLEDFTAAFALWLEGDYHAREHHGDSMDGQTPATVFAARLVEKRTAPDDVMEVLLWKPSPPVRCGCHGVTCEGVDYGKGHPALWTWDGKDVVVSIDPNDVNRAAIREVKTGRLICIAPANRKLPFNTPKEVLKDANAAIRNDKKAIGKGYATGPRKAMNAADRIYQDRIEQQRLAEPAAKLPPPALKMINTPISDQLELLRCAMDEGNAAPLKIAGDEPTAERPISMRELMAERMEEMREEREREEEKERQKRWEFRELLQNCFSEPPSEAEAV